MCSAFPQWPGVPLNNLVRGHIANLELRAPSPPRVSLEKLTPEEVRSMKTPIALTDISMPALRDEVEPQPASPKPPSDPAAKVLQGGKSEDVQK